VRSGYQFFGRDYQAWLGAIAICQFETGIAHRLGQMEPGEMTFLSEILLGLLFILTIIGFLPGVALLFRCICAIAAGATCEAAKRSL
jgi:hypothetical protein